MNIESTLIRMGDEVFKEKYISVQILNDSTVWMNRKKCSAGNGNASRTEINS